MIWIARIYLGAIAFGWLVALIKGIRATKKKKWVLEKTAKKAPSSISLSIVIPARNEERGVGRCLESARNQDHENLEIVILDDASTDQTPEIIAQQASEDKRIITISSDGEPIPDGWYGKPWALQRAQNKATGEWLLFIDADVELYPEAASRTLEYALENELDMVTGLGQLEMNSFWEKVLQPAVGALILAGNSLSDVNNPDKKGKNLANGQFILISREAYDRINRHASVKQNILDDVGIARAVIAADRSYHCLYLDQMFQCRMYTTFTEIWEGWTKNLFAGLRYSIPNVVLALLFTFSFSILGHVLFFLGAFKLVPLEMLIWGGVIVLLVQATRMLMDMRRGMNVVYGLTHAFASVIVLGIILNSMIKSLQGTVTWKGRTYKPSE